MIKCLIVLRLVREAEGRARVEVEREILEGLREILYMIP